MNIWSYKPLAALGMTIMLGACDAMDTGGGLLARLAPPEDAALPAVPLTQASMLRGSITLVPPHGYCIDAESLTQSFALMARCDVLGASEGGTGAPAGILTVSLSRNVLNAPLPTVPEIAAALNLSEPQKVITGNDSIIFRSSGTPPSSNLTSDHWRSVTQIDRFTMGAALFGTAGRRAVSDEGAQVLQDMIKRTSVKTNAG